MISLRGLRRKTKTVKSIQQITKAMKMVSSIKLKHARERLSASRPFAERMSSLLSTLAANYGELKAREPELSSIFSLFEEKKRGKTVLVVVTSDRGLCGSYNSNIIRKAFDFIAENPSKKIEIVAVGKKIKSVMAHRGIRVDYEFQNSSGAPGFADASEIACRLLELFLYENIKEVFVLHSTFKNIIQQPVVIKRLMPFEIPAKAAVPNCLFEPGDLKMTELMIPYYLKAMLYGILSDSSAAEHAARMSSMENATNNAQEVISQLTLQANKLRQEKITSELAEL